MFFADDGNTPQQRLAAAHARAVEQLADVHIPLYGLAPDWPRSRTTGSACFERGVGRDASGVQLVETHETVELVHERDGQLLRVESSDHLKPVDEAALADLLEIDGAVLSTVDLTVAGQPRTFVAVIDGPRIAARWVGDEHTVTIIAERWPTDIELVRITDLQPYHEGRLTQLEQHSGFRLR
jgi:hypothetical protein